MSHGAKGRGTACIFGVRISLPGMWNCLKLSLRVVEFRGSHVGGSGNQRLCVEVPLCPDTSPLLIWMKVFCMPGFLTLTNPPPHPANFPRDSAYWVNAPPLFLPLYLLLASFCLFLPFTGRSSALCVSKWLIMAQHWSLHLPHTLHDYLFPTHPHNVFLFSNRIWFFFFSCNWVCSRQTLSTS